MPAERLSMRKVREVLRLKYACGASERLIARSVGIGRTTVAEYLRRAAVIGITWPVPAELDDAALERELFAPAGCNPPRSKPLPDWSRVHAELRRRGVTLALLWEEYRAGDPDGYGYSRFCDLYGEWRRGISATMRQTHVAGEKLFVDYAGDTVPVFDALTGEVARGARSSSRCSGASNYTYAEARWSEGAGRLDRRPRQRARLSRRRAEGARLRQPQGRRDRGLPLRARHQSRPTRTSPPITASPSCRPGSRKPRDKAKVEAAVLIVERWILARLRNRRFFSLGELNAAIRELLERAQRPA